MIPVHLTPGELAARWRLGNPENNHAAGVATLANWRCAGKGPRWTKVGKYVRYPLVEVETYERDNTKG